MHKSRIGGIFIDHPARSFEASRDFWASATGRNAAEGGDPYASFGTFAGEVVVEMQRLDDDSPPRVHLDVDTDDVEAEADRLEALGARRLQSYDDGRYWQMVDPGGLVFCRDPAAHAGLRRRGHHLGLNDLAPGVNRRRRQPVGPADRR